MLSLSYINMDGAAAYYGVVASEQLDENASARERYYVQRAGIWTGEGARYLNLHGKPVREAEFVHLLAGQSPNGDQQLIQSGENRKHRAGIDWTFSAPKSVSIAAELIMPERKEEFYAAHNYALTQALRYFEVNYAEARQTKDYVTQKVKTGNLTLATFFERTSRSHDPQMHTHTVIANLTRRPDGKWRALTNENFHYQKKFMGQVYRNFLAKEVVKMGFAIETKPQGLFEIKGVPQEMIDAFSTRSGQIRAALPQLREKYPSVSEPVLKAMAAQHSRVAKTEMSEEALQELWQTKLAGLDIDIKQIRQHLFDQPQTRIKQTNHADMALGVLTQAESVVQGEDIMVNALKYSMGEKTIRDVERDLEHSQMAIKMDENLYSTQEMVSLEQRLAKYLTETANSQKSLLAQQRSLRLPLSETLTPDQHHALLRILSSRDKVTGLQGDAGTGKSTLAKTIASNYQRKGYHILALSPTALAAKGLREKGLQGATTIDRFLNRHSPQKGHSRLFLLEESSQLGSQKLNEILKSTHMHDRVLMIGDRNQHQSIDAGGIFHKVQQHSLIATDRLKENVRQQTGPQYLQDVVGLLAEQCIKEAFDLLDSRKRITEITEADQRLAAIVDKYAACEAGAEPMVITGTNAERQLLNTLIREALVAQGRISENGQTVTVNQSKYLPVGEKNLSHAYAEGDAFFLNASIEGLDKGTRGLITAVDHVQNTIQVETTTKGRSKSVTIDVGKHGHHLSAYSQKELEFAEGDKIVFLKNDKVNDVQNGLSGTVTELTADGMMSVETSDGRLLSVNTKDYGFFDYAYSTTSYKVQGSEHEHVIYHADTRHFNRFQNFYVAGSRARKNLEIITDSKERLLEQVQEQELKTSTLDYTLNQPQQGLGMSLDIESDMDDS